MGQKLKRTSSRQRSSSLSQRGRSQSRANDFDQADTMPESSKSKSFFTVGLFLVLYVLILGFCIPIYFHYQTNKVFNFFQISLAFFSALNFLISLWEIALGLHIKKIVEENIELKAKYSNQNHFNAVVDFFLSPLSLFELFSFSFWTKVWSTYSLYDPSYANRESFGFFVDVGNGWSTLLPTVLALVTMTTDIPDIFSPRTVGSLQSSVFILFHFILTFLRSHRNHYVVDILPRVLWHGHLLPQFHYEQTICRQKRCRDRTVYRTVEWSLVRLPIAGHLLFRASHYS